MGKLGAALGVSGMALYRHFRDKQALVDAILDHFVREADVAGHGVDPGDWRAWLSTTFRAMHRALAETPGVLPFITTSRAWRFGPAATHAFQETLRVLEHAGFSRQSALEVYGNALALAVGWATLDSGDAAACEGREAAASGNLFERGLVLYLGALDPHLPTSAR
jgi:AcrR family transcriptional regulator